MRICISMHGSTISNNVAKPHSLGIANLDRCQFAMFVISLITNIIDATTTILYHILAYCQIVSFLGWIVTVLL